MRPRCCPSMCAKKPKGECFAGNRRQIIERCVDREKRSVVDLAAQACAQRAFARPCELEQLSSVKPNSGLLSTVASARSSSGSSRASASTSRSITAMCSVSTSRSAPATGDARILERADDGFEQRSALAHQHQYVARLQSAIASTASHAWRSFEPAARAGFFHFRCRTARPSPRSLLLGRLDQRPQLDHAGRGVG